MTNGPAPTDRCFGCSSVLQDRFLDLGSTPLANAYPSPDDDSPEDTYPLRVAFCRACKLVQLTDLVPPEKLFSRYMYFSSYSDSFLGHAREMVDKLIERFILDKSSRVLEVASNDGYLLKYFQRKDIPVLGVEPAHNIALEAQKRGIPTLNRFFGREAVAEVLETFGSADVIIGNNVLAHVPDISGFLGAVAECLKPDGAAVFEFPYLAELLDKVEFDTIYHEHVFYYSLTAVENLARRAGLEAFDVTPQNVHGGSLRVFLQHRGARPSNPSVGAMLNREWELGLTTPVPYESFAKRVQELKGKLLGLLSAIKSTGKRIAAYGAPAKGNTLLNYCGIGRELVEFTVDRSPHKQGLLLPGSRLPILPPAALLARRPDYTLILPWNLTAEIVSQQRGYLEAGGRFIVPVPEPGIIGNETSAIDEI